MARPGSPVDHTLIDNDDIESLKGSILSSGSRSRSWRLPPGRRQRRSAARTCGAVRTAPASASSRSGVREANDPAELGRVLQALEQIQSDFNGSSSGGKKVSLADLIVLGGCAAVERAAKDAGHAVTVPFTTGRTDASPEQTDTDSFTVLEPRADGFRNYLRAGEKVSPETLLLTGPTCSC